MELKDIKQQFFTYRNGMLADLLRSSGDTHKVIFGLNLPQIIEIARIAGKDTTLAEQLWNNINTRESRLIAPMIYPIECFSIEKAHEWINSIESTEVADILCHKLLRYCNYAEELYISYSNSPSDILRYFALRLAQNLLVRDININRATLYRIANSEINRNVAITKTLALELAES